MTNAHTLAQYAGGDVAISHLEMNKMKKQVKENETEKGNGPVFTKKVGNVKASVFRNASDAGRVYFNIGVVRRYLASDGDWKDTHILNGTADGLAAIECLRCSIDFVNQNEADNHNDQE